MANDKARPIKKLCIRCNKALPLSAFFSNKEWAEQQYHDCWCKDCYEKYIIDKETLIRYCFENNRVWRDVYWDSAERKSQYALANDPEYISSKTTSKRRDEIAKKAVCKAFTSVMNLTTIYEYVDNYGEGDFLNPGDKGNDGPDKLIYDKVWHGYFTKEQIEILNDTYARYEQDFVLDNVNICDYARKVAKASLDADIASDRMRRGQISTNEYKEAQRIFDDMSKSSNFAACRRKPGESSGLGTLGEIILRLESNGDLNFNGFTFPEDDVDRIIHDFRHTLTAIGAEGKI